MRCAFVVITLKMQRKVKRRWLVAVKIVIFIVKVKKTVEKKEEKQRSIVATDKSREVGKMSKRKRMDEVEADKVDKGKLMRKPKSRPAYITKWMGQSQKGPLWPQSVQKAKAKKVAQSSLTRTKEWSERTKAALLAV